MLGTSLLLSLFLIVFSFFTAIISALTGMGGGIILLSFMTLFLSLDVVIPIHGLVQFVSNSSRSYFLKDRIKWDYALPFFMGVPLGTVTSYYIVKSLTSPAVPLAIIVVLIFYSVFRPKKLPPLIIPKWGFFFLGYTVGVLSLLIGATGPLIAPFFLRPDFKKQEIVATKAVVQMAGHILKIPAFLALGFPYLDYLWIIIGMAIFTVLGTKYGVSLLEKLNEKIFVYIFKAALLIAGIRILFKLWLN